MFKRFYRFASGSEMSLSLWGILFGTGGLASSFGIGALAASVSDWLNAYGPIMWVAAGFLCALLFALVFYLYGVASLTVSKANLAKHRTLKPTNINILESHFSNEIIASDDIFNPLHATTENKHFNNCRFSGSMIIYLGSNVTIKDNSFTYCNFIVTRNFPTVLAGVLFKDSSFFRCEFDLVTFVLSPAQAKEIRDSSGGDKIDFIGHPL